jgi:AcrR family transcriptional regulator
MNRHSPKATKLRDRLREVVHDEILVAAEEEFARQGLHKARMEHIASRAGVAVGTLYNHFQDRDALLTALLTARRTELCERLDGALEAAAAGPFRDQLGAFFTALLDHFDAHRPFLSILFQNEQVGCASKELVASPSPTMREVYTRAEALVARGLSEKVLKKANAELFPTFLMGICRSVLAYDILATKSPKRDTKGYVGALVGFFLEGAARA